MKYKVGDSVLIKSLDWYNANKDRTDRVKCDNAYFIPDMVKHCDEIVTISSVLPFIKNYHIKEDGGVFNWTDEMIEGLAEDLLDKEIQEHQKICDEALTIKGIEPTEEVWHCPEGYQFVDENGNVINTQKIVLEKKGNRYPKTYKQCCQVLGIEVRDFDVLYNMLDTSEKNYCNNLDRLLNTFRKLLICRDAYWKIAGEERGLEKPWKPDLNDEDEIKWVIFNLQNKIKLATRDVVNAILAFPTEEMRDAFYKNFEELIENCKELL